MTAIAKQEKTKMTLCYTDDEIELIGLPTHPELRMVISVGEEGEDPFFIEVREQTEDEDLGDTFVYGVNRLWFDGVEAIAKNSGHNLDLIISRPGKLILYSFYLNRDRHLTFGRKEITDFIPQKTAEEILL